MYATNDDLLIHQVIHTGEKPFECSHCDKHFSENTASVEHENEADLVSSEFISNLDRGGLTVPLISTVHFVYSAYKLFEDHNLHCCRAHLIQILSCIDSPMALIKEACFSMSNILLKAFVLDHSDKDRQLGCLRRREKLSSI